MKKKKKRTRKSSPQAIRKLYAQAQNELLSFPLRYPELDREECLTMMWLCHKVLWAQFNG